MTLNKLIEKYRELQKGYETITITQVMNDLYQVKSIGKPSKPKEPEKKDIGKEK